MYHHAHAHSRRDFFSRAFGGALAGASIVEEAFLRATWARAQAPGASTNLLKIEKIADGVYAALARPQVLTNCNPGGGGEGIAGQFADGAATLELRKLARTAVAQRPG